MYLRPLLNADCSVSKLSNTFFMPKIGDTIKLIKPYIAESYPSLQSVPVSW